MSFNIELKAQCSDLERFEQKVLALKARLDGHDRQTDTFFAVPKGRMKLRESTLYGNFLIPYLRPNQDGPKKSDYALIKTETPEQNRKILSTMFGIELVVRKERTIYLYDNVRIHMDRVEGLGNFIEFEAVLEDENLIAANRDKLQKLLDYFGIPATDLVSVAYADMLKEKIKD